MSNKDLILTGVVTGLLVAVYAFVQGTIEGFVGVKLELWPALIAPAMVTFFGGGKEGMKKYYGTTAGGILAGLVFVLVEHSLVPILGVPGLLGALVIIVAAIIVLGKPLPYIFGGAAFVSFNASLILTEDIFALTIARLAIVFIGATIFLFVDHKVMDLIHGKAKSE